MATGMQMTAARTAAPAVVLGDGWRAALERFVNAQDIRDSSRGLYTRTMRLFFRWAEASGRTATPMTRDDILRYKEELQRRGLSGLTVASYINAVRKFFDWLSGASGCANIAAGVRTPKRKQAFRKQHLTDDAAADLLDYFREISLRDYAIVNLMLRTGLRTVEVTRADVGDIVQKCDRRILRVWGKGRDERDDFVVLTAKAYEPIAEYLATRGPVRAGDPLFISGSHRNGGGRLSTRSISRLCKEGLRAIGLDGREYTAHSLRHTTAVQIVRRNGMQTEGAQLVLRHSNPATTQIYLESVRDELRLGAPPEDLLDDAFRHSVGKMGNAVTE